RRVEGGCAGIAVGPRRTTVAHVPGGAELTLTHAGLSYEGRVSSDGAFETAPRSVGGAAETHTLRIEGRFSAGGFEARVHAQVARGGAPAFAYLVKWGGTKNGP